MSRIADAHVVRYPDSAGKPMGETPRHVRIMLQTFATLDQWFEADPNVFAACNLFVYYQEGNPRKHVSPDEERAKEEARLKEEIARLQEELKRAKPGRKKKE